MTNWSKDDVLFEEWFDEEVHTNRNRFNSDTQHWHITNENKVKRCTAKTRDACKYASRLGGNALFTHFPRKEWAERQVAEIRRHEDVILQNESLKDLHNEDFGSVWVGGEESYKTATYVREFFSGKEPTVNKNFASGALYIELTDNVMIEAQRTTVSEIQEQQNYPDYEIESPAWAISVIEDNVRIDTPVVIPLDGAKTHEEVWEEVSRATNSITIEYNQGLGFKHADTLMHSMGQIERRLSKNADIDRMFLGQNKKTYNQERAIEPNDYGVTHVRGKLSEGIDERTFEKAISRMGGFRDPFSRLDVDIEDDDPEFRGESWRLTRGGVPPAKEGEQQNREYIVDDGWTIELGKDRHRVAIVHPEQAREVIEKFVKEKHPTLDFENKGKLAHDMVGYAMRAERKQEDRVAASYRGKEEKAFGASLSMDANRVLSKLFS